MTFRVEVRTGQVWLSGCIDTANAVAAREALEEVAQTWGEDMLVVNLSGVVSARSVVLSVLLRLMAKCEKSGRTLRLDSMPRRLFEMARVSGLDTVLPIESIHNVPEQTAWQP